MGILRADRVSGLGGANAINGSVVFNKNSWLNVEPHDDLTMGSGDFTIALFTFNDTSQSSNPVVIGANAGWYIQFKTGGTILEFYTGSTSIQATGLDLEGAWHHIAVTKASNVVKIFICFIQLCIRYPSPNCTNRR